MAPPLPPPASGPDVVAAGAVVTRKGPRGREVLLVHRPKYDDWSFPKGKQDPGEHVTVTAVREVLEETGVEVRLGRPLRPQLYVVSGGRAKQVHYWVGHVVGDDDISSFVPNDEVDDLRWVHVDQAPDLLTYLDDLDLLAQFREEPRRTTTVVILRHAKAVKREQWEDADETRPLNDVGHSQAEALVPVLHAYGIAHVATSPSTRCVQTVAPYASEQVIALDHRKEVSEDGFEQTGASGLLDTLRLARVPAVVCSHRPVLPELLAALGVEEEPLAPAEMIVCHTRKRTLVASERHLVR